MPYIDKRKELEAKAFPIFYGWAKKHKILHYKSGVEEHPEEMQEVFRKRHYPRNYEPDFSCINTVPFYMEVKYRLGIERRCYYALMDYWSVIQRVVLFTYVPEDDNSIYGKGIFVQNIKKVGFITKDMAVDSGKDNYIDDIWRKKPENHDHPHASGDVYALVDINTMQRYDNKYDLVK